LSGNDVAANKEDGIWLRNCSGNRIFHNNFSNNTYQTYVEGSINTWDKGYPSGGNYWGGFNPADGNKDKIGDVSYTIDENNTDSYPLIYPFEWYTPSYKPSPDLNEDGLVNVTDLLAASKAFGCKPGDPHWNPIADMGMNEIINIIDISKVAKHFGERV
jgi:parallel beta-helix repeat protein